MPSKSAQKKVVEPVVDAVVPETKKPKAKVAPVADAPVAKKETKPRAKKEAVPVVVPVVDVENVVVVDSSVDTSIADGFTEFIGKFSSMVSQFGALKAELKGLERKVAKQLKIVEKIQNKKKRKGTRAPSGFVKPSPISEELATLNSLAERQ